MQFFRLKKSDDFDNPFQFVGPLAEYQWVVYTRASSEFEINSLADLRGLSVGGYQNSSFSEYLMQQGIEIEALPYDALNLKKLTLGFIDAWVVKSVDVFLGINKTSRTELLLSLDKAFRGL